MTTAKGTHLVPFGEDLALVLDRETLKKLNIDGATQLELSTDGRSLILSPAGGAAAARAIDGSIAKGHARYGRMLKKLAE